MAGVIAAFHLMMKTQAIVLCSKAMHSSTGGAPTKRGRRDWDPRRPRGRPPTGAHSTLRERAGSAGGELARRWTSLWMRMSWRPATPPTNSRPHPSRPRFHHVDRGDYWEALRDLKGSADTLMKQPIAKFRWIILELSPWSATG